MRPGVEQTMEQGEGSPRFHARGKTTSLLSHFSLASLVATYDQLKFIGNQRIRGMKFSASMFTRSVRHVLCTRIGQMIKEFILRNDQRRCTFTHSLFHTEETAKCHKILALAATALLRAISVFFATRIVFATKR